MGYTYHIEIMYVLFCKVMFYFVFKYVFVNTEYK